MKLVAQASKKRSLADFQSTVGKYSKELKGDKIVARHLDTLYQTMLEQNLCRIIEPYSRVQVNMLLYLINVQGPPYIFAPLMKFSKFLAPLQKSSETNYTSIESPMYNFRIRKETGPGIILIKKVTTQPKLIWSLP